MRRLVSQPAPSASLSGPTSGTQKRCRIVGIGASAGGLEAFMQLLKNLPPDTGFGFVLVQHLDPLHDSSLREILGRATSMPVREAVSDQRVRRNQVYVIPPNKVLTIARGILKLMPRPSDRASPLAIDTFLTSLAQSERGRSIGIILSGNGSDGTAGLAAIKSAGGITFAQNRSAKYAVMPNNAVEAACVDFVLSPSAIAAKLASIAGRPHEEKPVRPSTAHKGPTKTSAKTLSFHPGRPDQGNVGPGAPKKACPGDGYDQILQILRHHSRVEFAYYKAVTLQRRIKRRAQLSRQGSLESYAVFLRKNPKEVAALYADVLINVTRFFRDPEAFEVLALKVFPRLLDQSSPEPIRVWVPGCSTGQEAYAIAMAFAAAAQKIKCPRKIKIFATDLSEVNLDKARRGFYGHALIQDLSPKRLKDSFVQEDGGYRISKVLRDAVVFARHDLTMDPPFSRMDLVSCRNLMIYLEPALQKKVLSTLHCALKPGGILFLGASESLGPLSHRFVPVETKQRIFAKKAALMVAPRLTSPRKKTEAARTPFQSKSFAPPVSRSLLSVENTRLEHDTQREADRVSLNHFAPPGVLINAELQIVQFRGATGAYLQPPSGKAHFDLPTMAREGLGRPLRETIKRACRRNMVVRREGIPIERNGLTYFVNIEVLPLRNLKERYCLVFFDDLTKPGGRGAVIAFPVRVGSRPKDVSARVVALERDLIDSRDFLQSVRDDQETANEELQAANEEGQSANEALQSLNEELETSKEELESTNEELITVNEEMTQRNAELDRLNDDLINLQSSTKLIVILFGPDLTVRRFSDQARKIFNLRAGDVGKPIRKIRHNLKVFDLEGFVKKGVGSERHEERQIQGKNGRWYSVRVSPYLTAGNEHDGTILLLVDIDDLKKSEQVLVEAQTQLAVHAEQLESLVGRRTAELVVANKTLEGTVQTSEKGKEEFRKLFRESEVMQKKLRRLTHQIITLQEEERKQISRELHDQVVQALIAIGVELAAFNLLALADAPAIMGKITYIKSLVENSVKAAHRFARGLRPAVLDDLGLIPAIHAYCRNLTENKNLKIEIHAFRGLTELRDPERTTLFRVAQEALTNVVRHANASRVALTIVQVKDGIRMQIADDGQSFDVQQAAAKRTNERLGLVGMRERLEMVGGTLRIDSAPGSGTTVEAIIPFLSPTNAHKVSSQT